MGDVGGQAVIEGVMMRSGNVYAIAVRSPEKDIVFKKETIKELPKSLKWPIIRGVVALGQALSLGIRALLYSAEASGHEEEKPSDFSLFMTVIVSFVIAIGLFFLLPLYGTKLLGNVFISISDSSLMFNLVDGLIRVAFFLIYIVSIRMMKDSQRVFQYHGAEHKVVHAYEAGVELTPENADNYSTLHPRCGTYEFIKMSSKKMNNPFIHYMSMPGLWLQKLTTGIPTLDQIEVAIKALKETLRKDPAAQDSEEIKSNVAG